jgi:hypothetical protein
LSRSGASRTFNVTAAAASLAAIGSNTGPPEVRNISISNWRSEDPDQPAESRGSSPSGTVSSAGESVASSEPSARRCAAGSTRAAASRPSPRTE